MIVIKAQAKKVIFRLSVDLCLVNVNLGYCRIITNLITRCLDWSCTNAVIVVLNF